MTKTSALPFSFKTAKRRAYFTASDLLSCHCLRYQLRTAWDIDFGQEESTLVMKEHAHVLRSKAHENVLANGDLPALMPLQMPGRSQSTAVSRVSPSEHDVNGRFPVTSRKRRVRIRTVDECSTCRATATVQ